jgi:hypothetical protein
MAPKQQNQENKQRRREGAAIEDKTFGLKVEHSQRVSSLKE